MVGGRAAVILAGGEGRRMGRDKGLVPIAGRPMVAWVADAIRPVVEEVVVSIRPDQIATYRDIPAVRLVADEQPGLGPIGGILAGFTAVRADYVAVAPCDCPLIRTELYRELFRAAEGRAGCLVHKKEVKEVLHAVYRRTDMLAAAAEVVGTGGGPRDVVERLRPAALPKALLQAFDPQLESVINVNQPAIVRTVEAILRRRAVPPSDQITPGGRMEQMVKSPGGSPPG